MTTQNVYSNVDISDEVLAELENETELIPLTKAPPTGGVLCVRNARPEWEVVGGPTDR